MPSILDNFKDKIVTPIIEVLGGMVGVAPKTNLSETEIKTDKPPNGSVTEEPSNDNSNSKSLASTLSALREEATIVAAKESERIKEEEKNQNQVQLLLHQVREIISKPSEDDVLLKPKNEGDKPKLGP